MKTLNNYIQEALIKKDTKLLQYNYHPKDFNELRSLLKKLLEERGKDANLNDIDVSQITTFYDDRNGKGLFHDLDPHNIKIDRWDISNVTDMTYTFFGCSNFTGNLSNWNVRNVKNMNNMFFLCQNFTGKSLENWTPIKCENMASMFSDCEKLNCNLSKWDVSNVEDMHSMFSFCKKFNCNLSKWKVDNVEDMSYMFYNCTNFKGNGLENWKPIKCKKMNNMFDDCYSLKNYPSWYKE